MKIAINTFPLNSLHAARGIGQYTSLLVDSLKKYDVKNTYVFFPSTLDDKVDVVHYPFLDIFQATLKPIKNTKTVVTIHDLIPLKYPAHFPSGIRGKINWWLQKNKLKQIQAIITDSRASARDIEAIAHIPKNKIHVIPLAVASDYKKLTRSEIHKLPLAQYNLPKDFVLYIGDINWNKNIPGLLQTFARLLKDKKLSNFHLILVGSAFLKKDLREAEEVRQIITEENIAKNVKMLGFVPVNDLVGIYNLARLYIQPSFDEGFGLTILEALSCGTAIVSSRQGSLPEIVGEAGDYFDPYSTQDMVQVLGQALKESQHEKDKKIATGFHQAKLFSIQKFIEQTTRVYENVATNSST